MRRRVGTQSQASDILNEEAQPQTELNGVRIQRLKNKLGTKSLPTAELELNGARGWLIGTEGQGVKEISAILNITRLHTAGGSVANWGRGLAICRAYSKVRKVRGGLLRDNPAHLAWMAEETVKYWACMECLGGVGYCENNEDGSLMNIAKIYRDNLVNPIWEGTVSVMAEDVVRVLTDKRLGNGDILNNVFMPWVKDLLERCSSTFHDEVSIIEDRLQALNNLVHNAQKEELLYRGRNILEHLMVVVSSAVLMYDANANPDAIAREIAVRWVRTNALSPQEHARAQDWKILSSMDRRIFLGTPDADLAVSAKL
ncbi:hypothetical protein ACET3X_005656 [Alternaria dauci]|uniref:Acyl-CoA dehydrogenase/oxidase C-terminal domain-containing protein n=1 Tax=Alternaria dauci TaxID=48095 RepID=A0ABR3UGU7_9PLEO